MDLSLLATLGVIHSVALMSPGPDVAMVLRVASSNPPRVALLTATGISLAILLHTLASLTGLSLIIQSSPWLFGLVQLAGASYLGWMGLGALRGALAQWRARSDGAFSRAAPLPLSPFKGFTLGLATNLLNPKALVFFLTLFSALITPQVNLATKSAAAVLLLLLSLAWFCLLALLLTKPGFQAWLKRMQLPIDALTGGLFLLVSVGILGNLLLGLLA
ncbi:LysE family transporter [Shewanella sedimentimangrovi]|uniref:LysE family transporter n=1 Tax=Shewanella sedimentimangrovi TaxID=2814293 RepID=A0ABX7R5M3_9GAMM|nr:LysE family transporter [Shewanella sedimentimangrovi]QSX39078.1 LysE family transporter [Shewanella sedimentimangrovi]